MATITETQLKIINVFLLLLKEKTDSRQITMSMIAEKSNISRQYIYRKHFRNIDDIIDTIYEIIADDWSENLALFILNDHVNVISYFSEHILPFFHHHIDWLKILYQSNLNPHLLVFLRQQFGTVIKHHISISSKSVDLDDDLLYQYTLRQVISALVCWLTSESSTENLSIFQQKFQKILNSSIL